MTAHSSCLRLFSDACSFKASTSRIYIGVSRTTFSTLASSTVSFDKCSSAAT